MKNVQHFFVKSQGSTKQETSTGYYVTFVRSGTTGMRGDIKRTKGFLQRVVQIQSCRHFVYKIKLRNVYRDVITVFAKPDANTVTDKSQHV